MLAMLAGSVEAIAQQTIVIGGSGLPPVEVNLDDALAPAENTARSRRGNRVALLPGQRPPLVDIGTLDPSLLAAPKPSTPRAARTSTPPKRAASKAISAPPTQRKPRAGTRIPATSLAAEIGSNGSGASAAAAAAMPKQVAALPKDVAAPPIAAPAKTAPKPSEKPSEKPSATAKPAAPALPPAVKPSPAPKPKAKPDDQMAIKPPPIQPKPKSQPSPAAKAKPPAAPSLPKQTTLAPKPPPPPPVAKSSPPKLASPPATQKPAETQKPPETKVAALPSARAPAPSGVLTRLVFPAGKADVDGPLAEQLDTVARTMRTRDERLLLQAYAAAGTSGSASGSRRLSLARALEVRSYLIRKGLKSTRIDVRALGTSDPSGPADRVDVLLLTR